MRLEMTNDAARKLQLGIFTTINIDVGKLDCAPNARNLNIKKLIEQADGYVYIQNQIRGESVYHYCSQKNTPRT